MIKFTEDIDLKLAKLAYSLNAVVSKDRPEYPEPLRTFEERRIDWIEGNVNKAIIFQPNFELARVIQEMWNLSVAAWYSNENINLRYVESLVKEKEFEFIKDQLDELLFKALELLKNMNLTELEKYHKEHRWNRT